MGGEVFATLQDQAPALKKKHCSPQSRACHRIKTQTICEPDFTFTQQDQFSIFNKSNFLLELAE